MSLLNPPRGVADQGSLVNAINRFCDRMWPMPPPTVRSVEVYYLYDNPYDGSTSPASAPIFGRNWHESQALAQAAVVKRRAEGFPEAAAAGPYIKIVSLATGEILY